MKNYLLIIFSFLILSSAGQITESPIGNNARVYGYLKVDNFVETPQVITEEIGIEDVVFTLDPENNIMTFSGGDVNIIQSTSKFMVNGADLFGDRYNLYAYGGDNTGEVDITSLLNTKCPGGDCNTVFYFPAGNYLIEGTWTIPENSLIYAEKNAFLTGRGELISDYTDVMGPLVLDTTLVLSGQWNHTWQPTNFLSGTFSGSQEKEVDSILNRIVNQDYYRDHARNNFVRNQIFDSLSYSLNPDDGYILTSDANGFATWQPNSGGSGATPWTTDDNGINYQGGHIGIGFESDIDYAIYSEAEPYYFYFYYQHLGDGVESSLQATYDIFNVALSSDDGDNQLYFDAEPDGLLIETDVDPVDGGVCNFQMNDNNFTLDFGDYGDSPAIWKTTSPETV